MTLFSSPVRYSVKACELQFRFWKPQQRPLAAEWKSAKRLTVISLIYWTTEGFLKDAVIVG